MKKIMISIMFLGLLIVFTQDTTAQYTVTRNAAISGHNTKTVNGTVSECKRACDGFGWCKSFDYHKGKNKCDLSNKSKMEVALKSDYPNNPYDHYSRVFHNPPNSQYKFCAEEGQNCNYSGVVKIAYGVNGIFNYKSVRSTETSSGVYAATSSRCDNENFGDSVPGFPKRCYVLATSAGSSSGAITGRNVQIVRYQSGKFRQIANEKTWAEAGSNNAELRRFTETGRDDWNVYLRKSDGTRIQLDLQNKVIKRNGKTIHKITSVWAP